MIYVWIAVALLIILDFFNILRFTAKFGAAVILLFMPHTLLVNIILSDNGFDFLGKPFTVLMVYAAVRLNLMPIQRHKTVSHRLNFLFGGKRLLNLGIYTSLVQIPISIYLICFRSILDGMVNMVLIDGLIAYVVIGFILFNGMIRVICTSKWLNIFKRLFCFWFIWVPVINIGIMFYLRHIASKEYDYFVYKLNDMPKEISDSVCQTKYPILLVHGVGFRDARFFNYWGRIPKELRARGATIFYGNQEGWATIEYNASLLHKRVEEVLKETGAKKLNIIAHSKGGLDCRAMINTYDMGDKIASLTTMCTPHRGVRFADYLLKRIPDKTVNKIADFFNKMFRTYGDTNPDFKSAVYSFTEKEAEIFNQKTPDSPKVYYQSYGSVMKNAFSDNILFVPYIIGCIAGTRENDGLVPTESTKWGNFKGIIKNKRNHGISHGDMIDLKREDYRGFDVLSKYVEIVSELKNNGY
jgi:triacylglycerol lipase